MQNKTIILLLFSLFGLNGCGFQLRGSQAELTQISTQISPILLSGISKKSPYYPIFAREYRAYQIQLADTKTDSKGQLRIQRLRFKNHILMVDKRNKAAEYETRLEVSFLFTDQQQHTITEKLIVTRSYLVSDIDVLGKNFERAEIRKEMVKQIARQILTHIVAQLPNTI